MANPIEEIKAAKDGLVHALQSPNDFRPLAREVAPDLVLALARGLLTLCASQDDSGGEWSAWLPRDYELRPDARNDIELDTPLPSRRPWLGEWIDVERVLDDRRSRLDEETGQYVAGYRVRVERSLPPGEEAHVSRTRYLEFERAGVDARQVDLGEGGRVIAHESWGSYPPTRAWARAMDRN